jgi:hypothetical protein
MSAWGQSTLAFASLDKAWKAFPKGFRDLRVLVFNTKGQAVLHYSRAAGASTAVDENESAWGMELTRSIYASIRAFSGKVPLRTTFYFEEEIVSVERNDPFIILVFWPREAVKMDKEINRYLERLTLTLQEELT